MKIVQLIKQLNNTELGKGGTHDTYVLVPNELDITPIFEQPGVVYEFIDPISQEQVKVRNTVGREKRIVGLGQYYRNQDLSAGDSVVFERRIDGENNYLSIHTIKLRNSIVFQKIKDGFEILTPDRMQLAQNWGAGLAEKFEIVFSESIKKRNDSPITTDIYRISIGGMGITDEFSAKEIGIVDLTGDKAIVRRFYGWKIIQAEEE